MNNIKGEYLNDHFNHIEKAFDKTHFKIKILNKLVTEGNFLNLIEDICENPIIMGKDRVYFP
jgi:hypothetical protein